MGEPFVWIMCVELCLASIGDEDRLWTEGILQGLVIPAFRRPVVLSIILPLPKSTKILKRCRKSAPIIAWSVFAMMKFHVNFLRRPRLTDSRLVPKDPPVSVQLWSAWATSWTCSGFSPPWLVALQPSPVCSSYLPSGGGAWTVQACGCTMSAILSARSAILSSGSLLPAKMNYIEVGSCCVHKVFRTSEETADPPRLLMSLSRYEGFLSPGSIRERSLLSLLSSDSAKIAISLGFIPSYLLLVGGLSRKPEIWSRTSGSTVATTWWYFVWSLVMWASANCDSSVRNHVLGLDFHNGGARTENLLTWDNSVVASSRSGTTVGWGDAMASCLVSLCTSK